MALNYYRVSREEKNPNIIFSFKFPTLFIIFEFMQSFSSKEGIYSLKMARTTQPPLFRKVKTRLAALGASFFVWFMSTLVLVYNYKATTELGLE